MSILMETDTFSFREIDPKEFNYIDDSGYVSFIDKDNQTIVKKIYNMKITQPIRRESSGELYEGPIYISAFTFRCTKKRWFRKDLEFEINHKMSFYTPDYYSIYMPLGYIFQEHVGKTIDEAIELMKADDQYPHEDYEKILINCKEKRYESN